MPTPSASLETFRAPSTYLAKFYPVPDLAFLFRGLSAPEKSAIISDPPLRLYLGKAGGRIAAVHLRNGFGSGPRLHIHLLEARIVLSLLYILTVFYCLY